MKVRLLAVAEAELGEAIAYYDSQSAGLGAEFASEIGEGLTRIEQLPQAWQLLGKRTRRYRLHRFPYGLVPRFRSPQSVCAPSDADFGIKGALATL